MPVENLMLGLNHSLINADPLFAPDPYIVGNPLTPVLPLYAPENADSASIDRVLPLEGGVDVRDLGGYPSVDGRRLRRGMFCRSGAMANITDGVGSAAAWNRPRQTLPLNPFRIGALPRRSMTGHLTSLRCRSRPSSRLRPPEMRICGEEIISFSQYPRLKCLLGGHEGRSTLVVLALPV